MAACKCRVVACANHDHHPSMNSEAAATPDFAIEVADIAAGWIQAHLRVGSDHLNFSMDDISEGPEDLAHWVRALKKGEAAVLTFGCGDWVPTLSGIPAPDGQIRLSASRRLPRGVVEPVFDCLVSIEQVSSGVRAFLHAVERHPNWAAAWFYWCIVPESLLIEAETCWQEQTPPAQSLPDELDPQDRFEAGYIAERMQFTLEQHEAIEWYRAKLVVLADSLR